MPSFLLHEELYWWGKSCSDSGWGSWLDGVALRELFDDVAVLLSQPVHEWGTEMRGISALCWRDAGAADAQLLGGQLEAGAGSAVLPFCSAWALKSNLNSSFLLTPTSVGYGGGGQPSGPTVEGICCLWHAWIFFPVPYNERCHKQSVQSFAQPE